MARFRKEWLIGHTEGESVMMIAKRQICRFIALTSERFAQFEREVAAQPDRARELRLGTFQWYEDLVRPQEEELMDDGRSTNVAIMTQSRLCGTFARTYFSHPEIATFFKRQVNGEGLAPIHLERTANDRLRLTIGKIPFPKNLSGLTVTFDFATSEAADIDQRPVLLDPIFLAKTVPAILKRTRALFEAPSLVDNWTLLLADQRGFEIAPGCWLHSCSGHSGEGFVVIDSDRYQPAASVMSTDIVEGAGWQQIRLPRREMDQPFWERHLNKQQQDHNAFSQALGEVIVERVSRQPLVVERSSPFGWERFALPSS